MDNGFGDVISGNKAIKVAVGVDPQSAIYLGLAIFIAVLLGVAIANKIHF